MVLFGLDPFGWEKERTLMVIGILDAFIVGMRVLQTSLSTKFQTLKRQFAKFWIRIRE